MDNQVSQPAANQAAQTPQPAVTSIPGAFTLIKESWGLYKQKYKTYLAITFLMMVMLVLPMVLFAGMVMILGGGAAAESDASIVVLLLFSLSYLLFILISQIIGGVGYIGIIYATKDQSANWKTSLKMGWKYLWPYMWIATLMMFIIFGGYMLLIIPGIVFAIWFSQSLYVLIDENKRGMDALLMSREYMRGKFWSVLWRIIVFTFAMIGVLIPFIIILAILEQMKAPAALNFFANIVVNFGYVFIFTPLSIIFMYRLYTYLKQARGNVAGTVTRKQKMPYIVIGIIGVVLPVFFFVLAAASILPFIASIYSGDPNGALRNGIFPGASVNARFRDAVRTANLLQLQYSLDSYKMNYNTYPDTLDTLFETGILDDQAKEEKVTIDPKSNQPYTYKVSESGNDYELCMEFEEKEAACFRAGEYPTQ